MVSAAVSLLLLIVWWFVPLSRFCLSPPKALNPPKKAALILLISQPWPLQPLIASFTLGTSGKDLGTLEKVLGGICTMLYPESSQTIPFYSSRTRNPTQQRICSARLLRSPKTKHIGASNRVYWSCVPPKQIPNLTIDSIQFLGRLRKSWIKNPVECRVKKAPNKNHPSLQVYNYTRRSLSLEGSMIPEVLPSWSRLSLQARS